MLKARKIGPVLAEPLLSQLTDFVAARTGLHFPRERWRDLERALGSAARELGFAEAESCGRWLLSSEPTQGQMEILASHLTVGETSFFRDRWSFRALEERVLPGLLRLRGAERRLRIWSAGCSTGEEPYSIALLLDRLIPGFGDWNVTLLATDINPRFLRKAAEGVYGEWSFRDAPAWIHRHFERRKDRRFELAPRLRGRVTFSCLNLARDAYPSLATNTNQRDGHRVLPQRADVFQPGAGEESRRESASRARRGRMAHRQSDGDLAHAVFLVRRGRDSRVSPLPQARGRAPGPVLFPAAGRGAAAVVASLDGP